MPAATSDDGDIEDPITFLMAKLTGAATSKPRAPIAYNLWAKENKSQIELAYQLECAKKKPEPKDVMKTRSRLTKLEFEKLSQHSQKEWRKKARKIGEDAVKAWEEKLRAPPSTDPVARQKVIENLALFMQPILKLACDYSGLKGSAVFGGPEPADGGRINIISIHHGSIQGPVEANFGQAERMAYKDYVIPIFGRFLQKCYTKAECRARALQSAKPFFQQVPSDEIGVHRADWDGDQTSHPSESGRSPSSVQKPRSPPPPSNRGRQSRSPSAARLPRSPSSSSKRRSQSRTPSPPRPLRSRSPSPIRSSPTSAPASPRPSIPAPPSTLLLPQVVQPSPSTTLSLPAQGAKTAVSSPSPGVASGDESPSAVPDSSGAVQVDPVEKKRKHPIDQGGSSKRNKTAVDGGVDKRKRTVDDEDKNGSKRVKRSDKSKDGASKQGSGVRGIKTRKEREKRPSKRSTAATPTSGAITSPSPDPKPGAVAAVDDDRAKASPAWFSSALSMLRSKELGEAWTVLVSLWAKFEHQHNYTEIGKRLSSTERPAIIGEWLKRARSTTYEPEIVDEVLFADGFGAWWSSLQPEWRLQEGGALGRGPGDWTSIRKPGVNGLLSVLAGLFLWGRACKGAPSVLWLKWVEEVHWAVQAMMDGESLE